MIDISLQAIVRSFALWLGPGRCINSVAGPQSLAESRFVRKKMKALFVWAAPVLLIACATDRAAIVLPPAERLDPVQFPIVPEGEALCDGFRCLSDRETGILIADLANALDLANAKILWLRDWAAGLGD